jgi:hypothetical protein
MSLIHDEELNAGEGDEHLSRFPSCGHQTRHVSNFFLLDSQNKGLLSSFHLSSYLLFREDGS